VHIAKDEAAKLQILPMYSVHCTTIKWPLYAFITNIILVEREPKAFGNRDSMFCIEELAGGYGVLF